MIATGTQPPLRPLGLAEVLDRAVTLCVNYFVLFSTIYLVYAIPLAALNYFATKDVQSVFASLQAALQHTAATGRPASQAEIARLLGAGGVFNKWTGLLIAATLLVSPLPTAALVEATAATYMGRPPTFAQAYRKGFARWLPLIGVNALYLICGLFFYFALVLAVVFVAVALAFLTSTLHAVGVAIDVLVASVCALGGIALGIVVALALQVSYFTCVVERAAPFAAFSQGLSRVFRGVGLKRSLSIGMAFLAIGIAIAGVSLAGQSIFVGLLHSAIAATVYTTIVRIATAAFTTAFIAIFYFDLRVREEGFDLTLAAQRARGESVEAT